MSRQKPKTPSLRSKIIAGTTWMVGMRWVVRGIGILSTIILVRLLAPEDFGLIAICTLIVAFMSILTSFGVDMALIQRRDAVKAHYDTAWTIRLIQAAFIAVCVFVLSPLLSEFFDEPRVVPILRLLALGIVIGGFENIGVVSFRKDLQFDREFAFLVAPKIGSFFVTISLALWLRNYWALVIGIVSLHTITVLLSYSMHAYRPTLSLNKFAELWMFSQWMLVRNIGMYLRKEIDKLMVGRELGTESVGFYSVSKEVAELPTTELIWPMARALFPGYAKLSSDLSRLGAAYRNVLSVTALIAVPCGVGLALVSEPLVLLVFGQRWLPVAPILSWLALYGVLLTISSGVQTPLMALGKMKRVSAIVWAQLLVAFPLVFYAAQMKSINYVAVAQVISALVLMPLFFYSLVSLGIVTWRQIYQAIWRPLTASIIMTGAIYLLPAIWGSSEILELMMKVIIGVLTFVSTTCGLWILSGRPAGAEEVLIHLLERRIPFARQLLGRSGR